MGGRISAIEVQKKHPNRVNVYADGRFVLGLSKQVAAQLTEGQELSEKRIAALLSEDAYQKAWDDALRFLSFRPRSCWEVKQRLSKKSTDPTIIEQVTQRLKDLDLLDDLSFAKHWIENRDAFRPRSQRLLQNELRQKGIAEHIIAEALETRSSDDLKAARALATTRAHRYRGLDRDAFFRKLGGYLGRRGFSWDIVRTVMDDLWNSMTKAGTDEFEEELQ